MNKLSRERHLWVRFFNQTKHMLRQPIELEHLGTVEFEKSICRAEVLERIWSDKDVLGTAPYFWCKSVDGYGGKSCRGSPVAIMGDYIIFQHTYTYDSWQDFTWVSAYGQGGPVVFQIRVDVELDIPDIRSYMDLDTGVFYIISPSNGGL